MVRQEDVDNLFAKPGTVRRLTELCFLVSISLAVLVIETDGSSTLRQTLPSSQCVYSFRRYHLPIDDLVSFHRRPGILAAAALRVLPRFRVKDDNTHAVQ